MADSISDHFYTGNESYLADINTTIGGVSRSLKRMPNDLVNDARVHNMPFRSGNYEHSSGGNTPVNPSEARLQGNSINYSNAGASNGNLYGRSHEDSALFSRECQKSEDVLFFKSISSNGATILKEYLPPALPQKIRNPIIIPEGRIQNSHLEDLSDDEEYTSTASGQWTSPVVKEALRRQVSKEQQFKSFWASVARLFFLHLGLLLLDYCIKLYSVRYYDVNTVYRNTWWTRLQATSVAEYGKLCIDKAYGHVIHLQWFLLLVILVNLFKLLKPQDQCWDLPLTESQRRLIGLSAGDAKDEKDGAFVMKQRLFSNGTSEPLVVPKYPRTDNSSGIIHRVRDTKEEQIALQNIIPRRRLIHEERKF